MKKVYIINAEGQIEQVNYNELVWQFVDMTTTPDGVAPRFHVREEIWFKVEGNLFEKMCDAEDAVAESQHESEDNHIPHIEEVTRFEGWTWGHQGNFPKQVQVFDTKEEAAEWLFMGAEMDFQNDCNAPQTFNTQAAAEEWVMENTNDQEPS
jgi:hypothetical protein